MDTDSPGSKWEPPDLLYEVGHRAQVMALALRKHRVAPTVGVCAACGGLPVRDLLIFGARCDVVVDQWLLVERLMRQLLDLLPDQGLSPSGATAAGSRVVGRARVRRTTPEE